MFNKFIGGDLLRKLVPGFIWLFIFTLYLINICPTVYLIDAGELTAVGYTLGIAHPTGYPLYTLLARIFALLPAGTVAFRINLMAVITGSLSSTIFFLVCWKILRDPYLALLPTSIIAFSHTLWNTSLSAEVYPLTALFIALILLQTISLNTRRGLYLLAFIMGLALSNHMIISTLLLPLIIYLILNYRLFRFRWFVAVIFFIGGLSIYLYLPLRAHLSPILNWGNPYNLERFFWHISGRQYQVWMFSSPLAEIINNLTKEMGRIGSEWVYLFLPLIFTGFYELYRRDLKLFWFAIAALIINIFYGINYSIPDIECYFLPTIFILGIITSYGLLTFKRFFKKGVVIILSLLPISLHFTSSTLQGNYVGYDIGKNILSSLPPTSIFITDCWDIYSPMIYIREIEREHRDITIIDKELLRRSWYFKYLKQSDPEMYERSRPEIESYLILLDDFEHNRLKDPVEIQRRYIQMLRSFIEKNWTERHCFLSLFGNPIDNTQLLSGWVIIPYGFTYEVKETLTYIPFNYYPFKIRKPLFMNDERLKYDLEIFKRTAYDRIRYLNQMGRFAEADSVRQWIRRNFD